MVDESRLAGGPGRGGMPEALRDWLVLAASVDEGGPTAPEATAALERFGENLDEFANWAAGISDIESLFVVRRFVSLLDRFLRAGWDLRYDGWTHLPRVVPSLGLLGVPPETTATGWIKRNEWILGADWGDEWEAWRAMLRLSNDYDEWSRHYLSFDLRMAANVCERMDHLSTVALGLRYPSHLDMSAVPFTRPEIVQGVRAPR